MKKLKIITCLTAALCTLQSGAAFAGEKIPAYMKPGTVIQYDSDKNMTVLREGKETENSQKFKSSTQLSDKLPEIEPNMTVTYDALGSPIVKGVDSQNEEKSETELALEKYNLSVSSFAVNDEMRNLKRSIMDDGFIYFISKNDDGLIKLEKRNMQNNELDILDNNSDRMVENFDIKNDKLAFSSFSKKSFEDSLQKYNTKDLALTHSIFESDKNGENLKEVADIKAKEITSVSYNSNGTKIIVSGNSINGDWGYGIYEISLDSGIISPILTEDNLKDMNESTISHIGSPALAVMSKDENTIYFTGVSKNSDKITMSDVNLYPTNVFSYDLNTKELKEVVKLTEPSLIYDLNIKY